MLTHIDIHHIVGLLSLGASPEKVEIELGSMVYDMASRERRDVDVTIRVENDAAYRGIEVKDHKRPLTSEHVEQLATKLGHMPSLSHRAIVSASGYTKPSVRKAEAMGIPLFELCNWTDRAATFACFGVEAVPCVARELKWEDGLHIQFKAAGSNKGSVTALSNEMTVTYGGIVNPSYPDVGALTRNLQVLSADRLRQRPEVEAMPAGERKKARVTVEVSDRPTIVTEAGALEVESATLEGMIMWSERRLDTEYKILRPYGGGEPLAGCAISDIPGLGLCGLMVGQGRMLSLIHIPVSARNLKKIYQRAITQSHGEDLQAP